MSGTSIPAANQRQRIAAHRDAILGVLGRYGATAPRLFGSVARGDATSSSDIDLLVDLNPGRGNALLAVAGIGEELTTLLGVRVDVVSEELLREPVAETARQDLVAL